MHMTAASSAHTETACWHPVTCMLRVLGHFATMLIRFCQLVDSAVANLPSPMLMPAHVSTQRSLLGQHLHAKCMHAKAIEKGDTNVILKIFDKTNIMCMHKGRLRPAQRTV